MTLREHIEASIHDLRFARNRVEAFIGNGRADDGRKVAAEERIVAASVNLDAALELIDDDPAPPPGGIIDAIPAGDIIYLDADISGWGVTSEITDVSVVPGEQICIQHTQSGLWPTPFENPVEGNVWVFAHIDGRWYGATWEWLRSGGACKLIEPEFPRFSTPEPLRSWRPEPGEVVGWAVSTHARNQRRTINERSGIVVMPWPVG